VSVRIFTKENIKILNENKFFGVCRQEMIILLTSLQPKNLGGINFNLRFPINFIQISLDVVLLQLDK
jgi:hypothetical protein